ncbi:MAG: response regulator, partial [Desulfobulbaceae bacterium]|nr:response regulator [Desulfobulbaceae bacterium]
SNAAEAMPEGGEVLITTTMQIFETPWRGFETVDAGEYVVVSIADKGIGISQEDMERVFEPFYTRKKMGRSGTGLGMAVVWGTVKDHDGYIDIQSITDKGTTFRLFLPTTDETPITTDTVFTLNKYRGQRQKVLVVDDSSIQREMVSRILTKLNYHVDTVESGEAAVEYLKLHNVELLILDMIMTPGIDGLETFRRIMKFKANQRTIVASGFSATDRVKEILKISGGKYLKKPYSLETLGLAV